MVPGGWQGGWAFDSVAVELNRAGHQVEAVTLAGPAPDGPAAVDRPPNLDTHIDQVAEIIEQGDGTPPALCGHSYGGMVIAGVAGRAGPRLDHLVFIDAYVPDDGDSCWSLTTDSFRESFVAGSRADGRWVAVPDGLDPRATAPAGELHPAGQAAARLRPRAARPDVHQRWRVAGQPVPQPDRTVARRPGPAGSRTSRRSQHRPPRPPWPRGHPPHAAAGRRETMTPMPGPPGRRGAPTARLRPAGKTGAAFGDRNRPVTPCGPRRTTWAGCRPRCRTGPDASGSG
ncbi:MULTISPECIES: alpha/beta fold hydrolase [unclassified Streptomyces]|uniref:alpha/beta fold hydrolase n=1 Tax=unclassified Streptomyces TaxID=2593676 RepID=UPI00381351E5